MNDWDKLMEPAREALEALIAEGDAMADRIEALTEQLAAARRDAEEAEAYAAKLEKERDEFAAKLAGDRLGQWIEQGMPAVTPPAPDAAARRDAEEAEAYAWQLEQQLGKAVDAMKALEKAAAEVSRRGAETGPQWTKLTVALLQARAALTQKDRTDD